MSKSKLVGWEKAIIEVLEKKNGIATLQDFYVEVPKLLSNSKAQSLDHNIRGYLQRLKNKKKLIKQVGLSTYSLSDIEIENNIFSNVTNDKFQHELLNDLPKENLHGYIEGFLIELGIFHGFKTYTPDKNVIFNGKKLSDLIDYQVLPQFTYTNIIDNVKQIDVIWLKDGFPYRTFDVENSTDFTKALLRAYQLRHFNLQFVLVAESEKRNLFERRISMQPFENIKEETLFKSYNEIYELYKNTLLNYALSKQSGIF